MTQVPNQFQQSVVKGLADLRLNPTVIPCVVASNESTPLVAGQAVKLVDIAGGVPVVTAVVADTDKILGFVSYNIKDKNFPANQSVEIISDLSVIYLQSSAAIARGAEVMYVVTGQKVATAAGSNKTIVGTALDKAEAADQLIRVLLGHARVATPTI